MQLIALPYKLLELLVHIALVIRTNGTILLLLLFPPDE